MLYLILIALCATQAYIIRHLAIDPGFNIKTRAAGELTMLLSLGRRDVVYGDIDHLGLINDALTSGEQIGHDRFNAIMRSVFGQMRQADIALVYGGDELRMLVKAGTGHGAAARLQQLLRSHPLTEAERARLSERTGKAYISITLGVASARLDKRAALERAKRAVAAAKPKGAAGRRGVIVRT